MQTEIAAGFLKIDVYQIEAGWSDLIGAIWLM